MAHDRAHAGSCGLRVGDVSCMFFWSCIGSRVFLFQCLRISHQILRGSVYAINRMCDVPAIYTDMSCYGRLRGVFACIHMVILFVHGFFIK